MPAQTTNLFLLEDLEEVGSEGQASSRKAIEMRFTPSPTGSTLTWSSLTSISAALDLSVPSYLCPWNVRHFGFLQSRSPTGTCQMLSSL